MPSNPSDASRLPELHAQDTSVGRMSSQQDPVRRPNHVCAQRLCHHLSLWPHHPAKMEDWQSMVLRYTERGTMRGPWTAAHWPGTIPRWGLREHPRRPTLLRGAKDSTPRGQAHHALSGGTGNGCFCSGQLPRIPRGVGHLELQIGITRGSCGLTTGWCPG